MNINTIEVTTIAIDLAHGIDIILMAINSINCNDIEARIVVFEIDQNTVPKDGFPPAVKTWSASSSLHVARLREELASLRGNKMVTLEIRTYSEVPRVHGAKVSCKSLKQGKRWTKHYITGCKLTGDTVGTYDWGDGSYKIVTGELDDNGNPELCSEFDDMFESIWARSSRTVLDVSVGG